MVWSFFSPLVMQEAVVTGVGLQGVVVALICGPAAAGRSRLLWETLGKIPCSWALKTPGNNPGQCFFPHGKQPE